MSIYTICLIISFSFVYVYDVVQFPKEITSKILSRLFKKNIYPTSIKLPKIFECSLCATTWTTLILLLIFSPSYCWLCFLFGWITKHIYSLFYLIDKFIEKLINELEQFTKY